MVVEVSNHKCKARVHIWQDLILFVLMLMNGVDTYISHQQSYRLVKKHCSHHNMRLQSSFDQHVRIVGAKFLSTCRTLIQLYERNYSLGHHGP